MTPAARLSAAIEIIDVWLAGDKPADLILAAWGRAHRFAGSKDRAAIAERVYGVLKRRARLAARMGLESGRALVLADLADDDAMTGDAIDAVLRDGGRHAPPRLTAGERAALDAPLSSTDPWTLGSYPQWLHPALERAFGDALPGEAQSWLARAPLDLRVNTLKTDLIGASVALEALGWRVVPTPFSPLGLRLPAGTAVTSSAPWRDGLVEVQDEGSQLAALMAGAAPGMTVCEIGAGAGGKSLALAAAMQNRGRLVAADVDAARLQRLVPRAARAGVTIIETRVTANADALRDLVEACDLVLIDAPCSGSGTWRREPENKWRLTPSRLAEHVKVQRDLLMHGSSLVRPGGRLVYVTCSLLVEENDDQVAAFIAGNPGFEPDVSPGEFPNLMRGGVMRLSPGRTQTDGFFAAALQRRKQAKGLTRRGEE